MLVPMIFPMLVPHGDYGYQRGIQLQNLQRGQQPPPAQQREPDQRGQTQISAQDTQMRNMEELLQAEGYGLNEINDPGPDTSIKPLYITCKYLLIIISFR
jgi:hypothetical protein